MAEFFKEQRKFLNNLGRKGVRDTQKALIKNDKVASGGTYNSVNFKTRFTLNRSSATIFANEAFKFIDSGRKAGSKQPPPKVIEDWIVEIGLRFTQKNGKPMPLKTMAFIIGRAIARDGIKPTGIIDKVFNKKSFQKFVIKGITKAGGDDIKTRTVTLAKQV